MFFMQSTAVAVVQRPFAMQLGIAYTGPWHPTTCIPVTKRFGRRGRRSAHSLVRQYRCVRPAVRLQHMVTTCHGDAQALQG